MTLHSDVDFLGRDSELTELGERLEQGRFVTVTGPPGVGKSRLVRELADRSEQRSLFVALERASDEAELLEKLFSELEIPLIEGATLETAREQLVRAVSAREPWMLVLDNFDHLVHAGIETVDALCADEGLTMIVTSRERLGIRGEVVLELEPLQPEDAEQLFRRRAAVATGAEQPDSDAVRKLVGALDRIPLAVELAAARAAVLPPFDFLERLHARFKLLRQTSGGTGRPVALEGVIDTSWELLSEEERAGFMQCAIFARRFDLAAAEEILRPVDGASDTGLWVIDVLDSLQRKSLVDSSVDDGGQARFGLLETLRHYGLDRLGGHPGLRDAVFARHADHFVAVGEAAVEALQSADASGAHRQLVEVRDELRLVHERFLTADPAIAARAALVFSEVASRSGPLQPADAMLKQCQQALGEDEPDLLAQCLVQRANILVRGGRLDDAMLLLDQASMLVGPDAPQRRGEILLCRARVHRAGQDFDASARICEELLAVARKAGDEELEGWALGNLGLARLDSPEQARQALEDALRLFQKLGQPRQESFALLGLGAWLMSHGRLTTARTRYERTLTIARDISDVRLEAAVLTNLALIDHLQGNLEDAENAFRESHALLETFGDRRSLPIVEANLGSVLLDRGAVHEAREKFESARRSLHEGGNQRSRAIATVNVAALEHDAGDRPRARELYDEALAALESMDADEPLARAHLYRALLAVESVESAERTRTHVDEAIRHAEAADARHWMALALAVRAHLLRLAGKDEPAGETFAAAERDLADVDAAPFHEFVECVKSRLDCSDAKWVPTRLVTRAMARPRPNPPATAGAAVRVTDEYSTLEFPGGEPIDLRRRRSVKLLLGALVEHYHDERGVSLSPYELLEVGWPDEDVAPDVGVRRVYTTINILRKMGFGDDLVTDDEGYHLRPTLQIITD